MKSSFYSGFGLVTTEPLQSLSSFRGSHAGSSMIKIEERGQEIWFAVKVHPRAKKNAITGEVGDSLKLSLTTPPIEGRANEACVEFFAKLLKVPRSSVTIASGQTSRNKSIRVTGVTAQYVRERLSGQ